MGQRLEARKKWRNKVEVEEEEFREKEKIKRDVKVEAEDAPANLEKDSPMTHPLTCSRPRPARLTRVLPVVVRPV